MKTKPSVNHILNTLTNTKFGLIKRIAFVQGSNRNEAHFVHERNADATRITIKRIARWRNASIYK